jgi:hypothetical protein
MTLMTAMTMNCKGSLNGVGLSLEMGDVRWGILQKLDVRAV